MKHDDTRQLKQRTKTINKMKAHKRKQESFEEKVMGANKPWMPNPPKHLNPRDNPKLDYSNELLE